MGHKSWGGARPNKWDIDFHSEPAPGAYEVDYDKDSKQWQVIEKSTGECVFSHKSIVHCEVKCEELNSEETA